MIFILNEIDLDNIRFFRQDQMTEADIDYALDVIRENYLENSCLFYGENHGTICLETVQNCSII